MADKILNYANFCKDGLVLSVNRKFDPNEFGISIQEDPQEFKIIAMPELKSRPDEFIFLVRISKKGSRRIWAKMLGKEVTISIEDSSFKLHVPKSGYVGNLEGVANCCAIGWVASLIGTIDDAELTVSIDGIALVKTIEARWDMLQLFGPSSAYSFSANLPETSFDGSPHDIQLSINNDQISSIKFSSHIRYNIESTQAERVRGWIFDQNQLDRPFDYRIYHRSGRVTKGKSDPREDVFGALGVLWAGFDCPCGGDYPFRISIGPDGNATIVEDRAYLDIQKIRDLNGRLLREHAASPEVQQIRKSLVNFARNNQLVAPNFVESYSKMNKFVIIVPVYMGLNETKLCFEALEDYCINDPSLQKIIIVNDRSPEPQIDALCEEFAVKNSEKVEFIKNDVNLGFVKSVNAALRLRGEAHDVLLLNADAVCGRNTLKKLRRAAYSAVNIASVTPLTNNGTIFSFPEVNGATAMSIGQAEQIDLVAERLFSGRTIEMPVGVGFCMYILSSALNDVGNLGEEWGRGYCEEVDWCMRARDLGYRHVAAIDTFVWHEGSVSFGAEEREAILSINHALLEKKYPEYVPQTQEFMRNDPLAIIRLEIWAELINRNEKIVFIFSHFMGGGTVKYVKELSEILTRDGYRCFFVHEQMDNWLGASMVHIEDKLHGWKIILPNDSLKVLFDRLKNTKIQKVSAVINSLIQVKRQWFEWLYEIDAQIAVVVHDFQWFCPQVVLVDHTGRYCGVESDRQCVACIKLQIPYEFGDEIERTMRGLKSWKKQNEHFLLRAKNVVAPSEDAAARMMQIFPELRVSTLYHPGEGRNVFLNSGVHDEDEETVRIAVVGALNDAKGSDFLGKICKTIGEKKIDVLIGLFGNANNLNSLLEYPCFRYFGEYSPDQLSGNLDAFRPNFVFFPGVWPETYSYVLSEVWAAGYPVVALDIGALGERVGKSGGGLLVDATIEAEDLVLQIPSLTQKIKDLHGHGITIDRHYKQGEYSRLLFNA